MRQPARAAPFLFSKLKHIAEHRNLASVCQKWPVIAFFVYLVEGVIWILVSFQFNDIYVFICLDEYVDAAIGRVALDLNLLAH